MCAAAGRTGVLGLADRGGVIDELAAFAGERLMAARAIELAGSAVLGSVGATEAVAEDEEEVKDEDAPKDWDLSGGCLDRDGALEGGVILYGEEASNSSSGAFASNSSSSSDAVLFAVCAAGGGGSGAFGCKGNGAARGNAAAGPKLSLP